MLSTAPVWIDIENPPQVQYLVPFVRAFHRAGVAVAVTARDAGPTTSMLRARNVPHVAVGGDPPPDQARKLLAVAARSAGLRRLIGRSRPAAVVCSSRAAALAAASLRIPCFVMCDYEHAELGIYRRTGATMLHPAVVPAGRFEAHGFRRDQLLAFDGIKEDVSFAGVNIEREPVYEVGGDDALQVLLRPPAESSHYFDPRSRAVVVGLLEHLASRPDVQTVIAPRSANQIADVESLTWRRTPLVLRDAVPFVPLLKGVDRVVSAGGTMLREAAYIGIPAFSLFAGKLGAVDDYLRRSGRLTLVSSTNEFDRITAPCTAPDPFPRNPGLVDQLAETVLRRAR